MTYLDYLNTGIVTSIFIALIYIGRKLEVLNGVRKDVDSLTADMRDVRDRLTTVEVTLATVEDNMSVFKRSLESLKQYVYKHTIK